MKKVHASEDAARPVELLADPQHGLYGLRSPPKGNAAEPGTAGG